MYTLKTVRAGMYKSPELGGYTVMKRKRATALSSAD